MMQRTRADDHEQARVGAMDDVANVLALSLHLYCQVFVKWQRSPQRLGAGQCLGSGIHVRTAD